MTQDREFWRNALAELKKSLELSPQLPRESVYELQHALNHILVGYRRGSRTAEIGKAIGHLRRAHLDYLKIQIFNIQENISALSGYRNSYVCAKFKAALIKARVEELCSVGTDHMQTILAYRNIITPFKHFLPQDGVLYSVQHNPAIANTAKNFSLLEPIEEELLWEWSQLELVITSITGQRIYDVVFNMVDSYLREDDFAESLSFQNASLKALLLEMAFGMDFEGILESNLASVPEWINFVEPNLEKAFFEDIDALNLIKEHIHKPFLKVLDFWGTQLVPLKT